MTRDQAEKIAKAVMDEIEQSRMISRDRLTDCIFNSYHKGTVDQYRAALAASPATHWAFVSCWVDKDGIKYGAHPPSTIDMQLDD